MAFDKLSTEQALHIDEFIQIYNEAPFEWIDGERIPIVLGIARHVNTIRALRKILEAYAQKHNLGEVYTEAPFVLEYKADWVNGSRVPDLIFFRSKRFEKYKTDVLDWQDKPFVLVPDLAIEVVSPNDRFSIINKKVNRYLDDGVELVWVLDPQEHNVYVHQQGQTQILGKDDTLDGASVLPNLKIVIKDVLLSEE
jgi:Uma2 family endonuclease